MRSSYQASTLLVLSCAVTVLGRLQLACYSFTLRSIRRRIGHARDNGPLKRTSLVGS